MSQESIYDIAVIGAGIVGLSTAWQLQKRYPKYRILLIEKEAQVGLHQTGHNSGVIHAGVYYAPGSLKAEFCYRGAKDTKAFCREHNIEFEECGKLLVATNEVEYERMQALYKRCRENGLKVELLDQAELNRREPNVKGVAAIYVASTGIVNYQQICQKIAELFEYQVKERPSSSRFFGQLWWPNGRSIDQDAEDPNRLSNHPIPWRVLPITGTAQ